MNNIVLKTTNTLTGEIFTTSVNPTDPDSLADCLLDIQSMKKNLEQLEKEVKEVAEDYLASNNFKPVDLADGKHRWVYKAPQRKLYSFTTVRSYIDEDLLLSNDIVTVSSGKLEKLITELVKNNQIDAEATTAIQASVELKPTKAYVQLEKIG